MRKLLTALFLLTLLTPISSSQASNTNALLDSLITKTQTFLPKTNFVASYRVEPTTELQIIAYSSSKNTFKITSNPTSYFTPNYIYTDTKIKNLAPFITNALRLARVDLNKYDYLRSTTSANDPGKLLSSELFKFYDQQLKNSTYTLTSNKNIYQYKLSAKEDYTLTFSSDGLLTKINYRKNTTNLLLLSIEYLETDKLVIPTFKNNFDIQKFSTTKIFIDEKYKYALTQELYKQLENIAKNLKDGPSDVNTYYKLLSKDIKYPAVLNAKGIELTVKELAKNYKYCATLLPAKDKTISLKIIAGKC